ncbi:MAG: glycosyltransferase family 1 protein, partial [Patescibacteria group bacterium]
YGVSPEKISVVYHGFEIPVIPAKKTIAFLLREPFFLHIGRIESKKNVGGIVRAFEIFKEKYGLPHKLILLGGGGFGAEQIKDAVQKSKFADDVCFGGYVPSETKDIFLKKAAAFLFPSFYEGFGLPILEAQSAGVPVLTSNLSSMPEVAGEGGALFVDPKNVDEIAEKMYKIVSDKNLRENLIKNGFENVKKFSWKKCAQETLKIVSSL